MRTLVEGLLWRINPFIRVDYSWAATDEEILVSAMVVFAGLAVLVAAALTLDWLWDRHKRKKRQALYSKGLPPKAI